MPAAAESQTSRLSVGATVKPSCAVSTTRNAPSSNDAPVQVTCSSGAQWTVTTRSGTDPGSSPVPGPEGAVDRSQPSWITITY